MSDVQDPLQESEKVSPEPAEPAPDKKIVFGSRKPTEEISAVIGIPPIIEAPFPFERTLQWLPNGTVQNHLSEEASVASIVEAGDENGPDTAHPEFPPFVESDGSTAVIVSQEVLLKVNEHVAQSLERELGGFLLGNRYRCPNTSRPYVIIDQYTPAKFIESTEIRLAFTHEAWAQLSDELSGKFLGKLLIGWYHSHPRMDVFLSNHDMEIQNERFAEPWNVALVLEPEKHRGGFFCAREGRVSPHTPVDFFELLERNSRDSVLAWENYTSLDPSTSAAPVLSATNTASHGAKASQEIEVARSTKSKKVYPKKKRRGRILFTIGVIALILGAAAVGVANRKRLRTWLHNRTAAQVAPSPQPTPVIESTPAQPTTPSGSAQEQRASSTPQGEPTKSPSLQQGESPTKLDASTKTESVAAPSPKTVAKAGLDSKKGGASQRAKPGSQRKVNKPN